MAFQTYSPSADRHYIADTVMDLADIPFQSMGDTCFVIENNKEYIANSKGEWICSDAEATDNYITKDDLAAMPFAKIMRENGEHKIALGPTNDMMLVDKMDELGPGLYTMYMERSCQDIPAGAREINSSCRGIFFVDTYKIAEQNSQHFYGWALLFDHAGNVYSKYVRRSIASEWKKLS